MGLFFKRKKKKQQLEREKIDRMLEKLNSSSNESKRDDKNYPESAMCYSMRCDIDNIEVTRGVLDALEAIKNNINHNDFESTIEELSNFDDITNEENEVNKND